MKPTRWLMILFLVTLIFGCGKGGCRCGKDEALVDIDPARLPQATAEPPVRAAAAQILVAHRSAFQADPSVTRTRDEALELATELRDRARGLGADFFALAREHSDGPTAARGGRLGVVERGRMAPEFEDALFAMGVGQVSEVVETSYGFHVIQRLEIEEVGAAHILLQYAGTQGSTVSRSREEARALAEELLARCRDQDSNFSALAAEHSECPSAPYGGSLGRFSRGQLDSTIEATAFALKPDSTSGLVETAFGFHIIRRTE
jgi:parvulin-like peptidyl-prolyl isomerase